MVCHWCVGIKVSRGRRGQTGERGGCIDEGCMGGNCMGEDCTGRNCMDGGGGDRTGEIGGCRGGGRCIGGGECCTGETGP